MHKASSKSPVRLIEQVLVFMYTLFFLLILETGSAPGKKCVLNREVVSALNNEFRWVLDIDQENVCECTTVEFGNIYRVPEQRNFDPIYIQCPGSILGVDKATLAKTFSC